MQKRVVLTVTGSDRVGIVEEVTKIVLGHRGNVESSRMARLGGEFAMLMLISLPSDQLDSLQAAVDPLRSSGFELIIRPTVYNYSQKFAGWPKYQLSVRGADHEGIIHEITRYLAEKGVNIEGMDTGMEDAPFGGTVLFTMQAEVVAPAELTLPALQDALEEIGDQLQVEAEISSLTD